MPKKRLEDVAKRVTFHDFGKDTWLQFSSSSQAVWLVSNIYPAIFSYI